jgi:hypothetical protein
LGEVIGTNSKKSLLRSLWSDHKDGLGFLIPKDNEIIFHNIWDKNITDVNGSAYCKCFNVQYLVVFDEKANRYYFKTYNATLNKWI